MSEENVEIVRTALTEFDESRRLSDSWAPDFVWDVSTYRGAVGPMEYHGWRGFYEFFEDWVEPDEEWEQEIDDVLDAAGSRVVVVLHQRGRLRGTQDWVGLTAYGQVHTVEEGLIRRVQLYATPEEALEAAGISE